MRLGRAQLTLSDRQPTPLFDPMSSPSKVRQPCARATQRPAQPRIASHCFAQRPVATDATAQQASKRTRNGAASAVGTDSAAVTRPPARSQRRLKIDMHTHILPKAWPNLKERYGYGGWVRLEHHSHGKCVIAATHGLPRARAHGAATFVAHLRAHLQGNHVPRRETVSRH